MKYNPHFSEPYFYCMVKSCIQIVVILLSQKLSYFLYSIQFGYLTRVFARIFRKVLEDTYLDITLEFLTALNIQCLMYISLIKPCHRYSYLSGV